ncbi:MAG TPA: FAD-dependent oxidoreductase [Thermodesulfobacteriota bacterium]|nr:FAD-dependent oxidoreductase [Thermodesulfobacteriota bacterium]
MNQHPFPKLTEPGRIGSLIVRNRIASSPMITGYATRDGMVTDRLLRFYEEKAKGGVGLIIVEYAYIDLKASVSAHCQLGVYDDACIIGLAQLAEIMQQSGAKACVQIEHCGRQKFIGTYPMVAPSRVPWEELVAMGGMIPTELTIEEIKEIVESFGNAARRVKQAGFDMVEIHGAHGYLITNFLSPHTNRRTDMYGGGLKERMHFGLEVAEDVRKKVGPDFPVGIRLSGTEYMENGVMIEDTVAFAKALENAGVNVFHISGGNHHTMHCQVVPSNQPLAFNVWAAEAVKKEVKVPVIASGSITSPALAETIIKEGKADFVGLARPLLADPYFPKKAEEGRAEEVRPCIRCNQGCLQKGIFAGKSLMCSVNIAIGREDRLASLQYGEKDPAPQSKKVLVVGGGPGGMEAARVAALRGHKVILFEKRDRLGGALLEASVPEFKSDLRPLIAYLSNQLRRLKVQVNLRKEITAKEITDETPDAVIVSNGSKPSMPEVPGIEKPIVVNGLDIYRGKEVGKTAIIVGGGMLGSELALFLGEKGKKVILTTRQGQIGYDMEIAHFIVLMDKLVKAGVQIHTHKLLQEVTDDGVVMLDLARLGEKVKIRGDNVIIMGGFQPDAALYQALKNKGLAVYAIGDCVQPRGIHEAIYEGHLTARSI